MYKFLCQDCLFVVLSDDWDHYHNELGSCPKCGGDMCGCESCLDHINSCKLCQSVHDFNEDELHQLCSKCGNSNPCVFLKEDSILNKKEITEVIQNFLTKIKVDNNLNFRDFEKVVCDACNNVTEKFGDKE